MILNDWLHCNYIKVSWSSKRRPY